MMTPHASSFPEALQGFVAVLLVGLSLIGLVYRFRSWMRKPDEKAARKNEQARQRLKRTVRRPARDVPIHDGLDRVAKISDPAINVEGLD